MSQSPISLIRRENGVEATFTVPVWDLPSNYNDILLGFIASEAPRDVDVYHLGTDRKAPVLTLALLPGMSDSDAEALAMDLRSRATALLEGINKARRLEAYKEARAIADALEVLEREGYSLAKFKADAVTFGGGALELVAKWSPALGALDTLLRLAKS